VQFRDGAVLHPPTLRYSSLSRTRDNDEDEAPGECIQEKTCPAVFASFVVFQNMNTDYGLFHLFNAVRSLHKTQGQPAIEEISSRHEPKLPEINFSLLRSARVRQRHHRSYQLQRKFFSLKAPRFSQCPDCIA
jgi:hypothetical protein